MEYLKDHGFFANLPYDRVIEIFRTHYPIYLTKEIKTIKGHLEEDAVRDNSTGPVEDCSFE